MKELDVIIMAKSLKYKDQIIIYYKIVAVLFYNKN